MYVLNIVTKMSLNALFKKYGSLIIKVYAFSAIKLFHIFN